MSEHYSPCRCCRDVVCNLSKRFDASLGSVCRSCYAFSLHSDKALREHGIVGSVLDPVRPTNNEPETP